MLGIVDKEAKKAYEYNVNISIYIIIKILNPYLYQYCYERQSSCLWVKLRTTLRKIFLKNQSLDPKI